MLGRALDGADEAVDLRGGCTNALPSVRRSLVDISMAVKYFAT